MTKEDLEKLYRTWEKEKLLETFKNREDYTEVARAAMLSVIKEKGLSAFADEEVKQGKIRAAQQETVVKENNKKNKEDYEAKMLGENTDAKEYAEKNRINGEYMSGKIAGSKYKWARSLLTSFSIMSLLMCIGTICIGPLFRYSEVLFGGSAISMIVAAVFIFKNSKATYRFYRQAGKDVFEIEQGSFSFKASAPFHYFVCWNTIEHHVKGIKISHPVLFLGITDKVKDTVVLSCYLTALQDAPPDWPHVKNAEIPKGAKFYNEILGNQLKLIKLKKILDGLHQKN